MLLKIVGCTGIVLLLAGAHAVAQTKPYRIGWLGDGSAPAAGAQSAGDFQQGLRDIGYIGGRSVPAMDIATQAETWRSCPRSLLTWCGSRSTSSLPPASQPPSRLETIRQPHEISDRQRFASRARCDSDAFHLTLVR